MKTIFIKISDRDEDGSIELCIRYESNRFSGEGTAWFSPESLEKKIACFSNYPISEESPPCIEGGYYNAQGDLEHTRLHLSVRPKGLTGHLVMHIKLAEFYDDYGKMESTFSFSGQLKIEYAQLKRLADNLLSLINGVKDEVILRESS